ncbi:MAG TPA: hypothetical protein VHT71_20805 [Methylomirabilota bacterium]|jgi:Copper binding periplasmic protein CusF|nr:hypothetical protein [Methylomirabilota bacterium]
MNTPRTLTLTLALGLTLVAGAAYAAGDEGGYSGEEIGTISFIDRPLSLIILSDAVEFRAPDPAMLNNLKEGDIVKVDFTNNGERTYINSIAPATADDVAGASPASEVGEHLH